MQAMSTAQTRVTEAEQALAQNGAQLAALRALSQRLTIGQETVDAALEILWAEETRLSDALGACDEKVTHTIRPLACLCRDRDILSSFSPDRLPDELETRLSSRPADGGEHAEAERAEAKVAAHEAHAALGSVQQSLVDVTASVQPAAARPTPMTETEEELREAVRSPTSPHSQAVPLRHG